MLFFLKLVAAAFCAFVLLILVVYFWIRWKFRKFFKSIGEGLQNFSGAGEVPPFHIDVEPLKTPAWSDELKIMELTAAFEEQGFQQAGEYQILPTGVMLRAFYHPEQQLWGVIYDYFLAGIWCDIVKRFANGDVYTLTTKQHDQLDRPEWSTVECEPEQDLAELITQAINYRSNTPVEKISGPEEFPQVLKQTYERVMDWRIERGGVTEEEIRRTLDQQEQDYDQKQIETIDRNWKVAISEHYSELARKQFLKVNNLPLDEYEEIRDRLVFVHDYMTAEEILAAIDEEFYVGTLDWEDEELDEEDEEDLAARRQRARWEKQIQDIQTDLQTDNARVAFQQAMKDAKRSTEFAKRKSLVEPLPTDVYVRPAWDDDYED